MSSGEFSYESLDDVAEDWAQTDFEKIFLESVDDPTSNWSIRAPEAAKVRLLHFGYQEDDFLRIFNQRRVSHEVRAEIVASAGTTIRLHWLLLKNFRLIDNLDGVTEFVGSQELTEDQIVRAVQKRLGSQNSE